MGALEVIAIAGGMLVIARVIGKYRQSRRAQHPGAGRFCHICGADAQKHESCDAGLHS